MIDGAVLKRLLANRQIESAQLMIQWPALGPENEKAAARAFAPLLRADFPQSEGEVGKPPSGLVFTGQDKTAQFLPGVFNILTRLKHDHRTNIRLLPFDQVYVGETRRAQIEKAIPPWLRRMYQAGDKKPAGAGAK